jgi:heat shock protein HtpX
MMPASFIRSALYVAFLSALLAIMSILVRKVSLDVEQFRLLSSLRDITFAFIVFASLPLFASFLMPKKVRVQHSQELITAHAREIECDVPIHVIASDQPHAFTIGLSHRASQVFITTYFLDRLSPGTLKYIIAHENTHIREQHIGAFFIFLCVITYLGYLAPSGAMAFLSVLALLAFRRYCEYRADRGAARTIGVEAAIAALQQLAALFPTPKSARYLVWILPYPTLAMRIAALATQRLQLF